MRILTIGVLAFTAWSIFSTYLYVCKIKGLCNEPVAMQMNKAITDNNMANDTLPKVIMQEKLALPNDLVIYFAFDKSDFSSKVINKKYFDESLAYLNEHTQLRMKITGHTDAIGTKAYNNALGYRRAQSVQHYFLSKGLPKNLITIESKGENQAVDNNKTKEGRANNRRTVITFK